MKTYDLKKIVRAAIDTVKTHELSTPGAYCRWLWQNKSGSRKLGINEYGCADAANILYTVGEFATDDATRSARIDALRSMQDPESGMFTEATHHTIHTTAHCTAALELFDAKPLYPLKGLHKYFDKGELYSLLDGLDWACNPWPESHKGAGVYAALVCADEITPEFSENYFAWFKENADPVSGFWKKGYADKALKNPKSGGTKEPACLYEVMAGGFHYLFNHEHAHMPLEYPERVIDSCLDMFRDYGVCSIMNNSVGFIQIDWIFCLTRASRQTSYKWEQVREALLDFADIYVDYLNSLDYEKDEGFNDLHMLFGTMCALAELQSAFPGRFLTDKPLKLVLDRRPFI